jgi:hypothetical protein
MSEQFWFGLFVVLYKIIALCVGLLFGFMGYRLFMAGIWGNAADLDAQFRDSKLVMRKAAPGVFFALFGTIIVAYTVFVGIKWESPATHADGEVPQQRLPAVPLPENSPF